MDKAGIIRYFSNKIELYAEIVNEQRQKKKILKEKLISMEFQVNRGQRVNHDLSQQIEYLNREYSANLQMIIREKDTMQQQLFTKDNLVQQYANAFEDLKCKNYQMENVAFTYHMTVQRLKEKEIELMQKFEDNTNNHRNLEISLRMKHEEAYQMMKERDHAHAELNNHKLLCESLKEEVMALSNKRIQAENELYNLKE